MASKIVVGKIEGTKVSPAVAVVVAVSSYEPGYEGSVVETVVDPSPDPPI